MQERPQEELLGLDLQELTAIAVAAGQPAYRGRQLFEALYRQRVEAVDQITTLPNSFRSELTKNYASGLPQTQKKFISLDGTVRYLIGFADGQSVETVWMPEGDNGEQGDGSAAGEEEADTPQSVAPPLSRPREPAAAAQGGYNSFSRIM